MIRVTYTTVRMRDTIYMIRLTYTTILRKEDVSQVVHCVSLNVEELEKYDVVFVSLVRHQRFRRVALIDRFNEDFERCLLFSNLPDRFISLVLYRSWSHG